jgi:hypothetical protein
MVVENPFGKIRKVETAEEKVEKKAAEELGMTVEQYREHMEIKAETEKMGEELKAEEKRDENREIKDLNNL